MKNTIGLFLVAMVYAQISDGEIKNVVKIDDITLLSRFSVGFQCMKRIDNIKVNGSTPGIGWNADCDGNYSDDPERGRDE